MDEKLLNRRKLCLNQAQGFIDAARHLSSINCPHIIYHLSLLALEEVGKAGILSAQTVSHARGDDSRLERWLDSHPKKLLWAVWSPIDRIDPADFIAAQKFSEQAHAQRLASLYVNPKAEITDLPPCEQVSPEYASEILEMARARLEFERARGAPTGEVDGLMEWFFETMDDPDRSRQLLSKPFSDKFEEFKGDARAWIAWSRDEFERLEKKYRKQLEADLARPAAPKGVSKPRWRANAIVYTSSHSLRSKVLTQWNDKIDAVKLLWADKKDRFTLQITLQDNEPLSALPGRVITLAKLTVACLNIGSIGYFWFEQSGFERKMFKDIRDLESKQRMAIEGGKSFWGDGRVVSLTEEHVDHALHCMMAFAPLPEAQAEPIFMPYFHGLALIAKSDIFYNFDELARRAFIGSLAGALQRYGGWSGKSEDFESCFHASFTPFMPEFDHRAQMFKVLTPKGDAAETSLDNLRSAKQLADLYLIHTARRTWRTILDKNGPSRA